MAVVDYEFRLLVVDKRQVILLPKRGEPKALNESQARYAMKFLGLDEQEVPKEPRDRTKPPYPDSWIGALVAIDDYGAPITVEEYQLLTNTNPNTVSSRFSQMQKAGLLIADRTKSPRTYTITPRGAASLPKNVK